MLLSECKPDVKVKRKAYRKKKLIEETGTVVDTCWYNKNKCRVEWDSFSEKGNPIRGWFSVCFIKNLQAI